MQLDSGEDHTSHFEHATLPQGRAILYGTGADAFTYDHAQECTDDVDLTCLDLLSSFNDNTPQSPQSQARTFESAQFDGINMLRTNLEAKWQLSNVGDIQLEVRTDSDGYEVPSYDPEMLQTHFSSTCESDNFPSQKTLLYQKRGKYGNKGERKESHKKRRIDTEFPTPPEKVQGPVPHKVPKVPKAVKILQVASILASTRLEEIEQGYTTSNVEFLKRVEQKGFLPPTEWTLTTHTDGVIYTPVWLNEKSVAKLIPGTSLLDPNTRDFIPCIAPAYLIRVLGTFDCTNRTMRLDGDNHPSALGLMAEYNYRWCKEAQSNQTRPQFMSIESQFRSIRRRSHRKNQFIASWLFGACGAQSCLEYGHGESESELSAAKLRTKNIVQSHFSREALPTYLRAEYGKPVWVMYIATQVLLYLWKHIGILHTRNVQIAQVNREAISELSVTHQDEIILLKTTHANEIEVLTQIMDAKDAQILRLNLRITSLQSQVSMMTND